MPQKITTYSLGFEGDPKHSALIALGSWSDEQEAANVLRSTMGWEGVNDEGEPVVFRSPIFQVSYEVAAFAVFETAEERDLAIAPYVGAPRMYQHNALVVPA